VQFPRSVRAAALAMMSLSAVCYASGGSSAARAATLTLYSGQHEQTVDLLIADFEKETGIKVRVHSGEGPEVASQLVEEGADSPADVYFTENTPELVLLEEKGLLTKVAPGALASVPAQYNSPKGYWLAVFARENVLAYNPTMVKESELPASLLDLAQPAWKGKLAIAPTDADFLPVVGAVLALKGKDATLAWLNGLKENAEIFDDDEAVVAAVDGGRIASGIINNYYWDRLVVQQGEAATKSKLYHFTQGDPGAVVNVSGAAILKSAPYPTAAQKLLAYLVSERAQQLLARSRVNFEYPLRPGVSPDPMLKPFKELQPPALDSTKLGDDSGVGELLQEVGLL
jgi:iron(III) transport system substrate-binding protein